MALLFLGSMFGGVQWLAHVGQLRPAGFDVLMAMLCLAAAAHCGWRTDRLPTLLQVAIVLVSGLFLANVGGLYLVSESNGRIVFENPALIRPFLQLSEIAPTSSAFTALLPGYSTLVLLPGSSLVLALVSRGRRPNLRKGGDDS